MGRGERQKEGAQSKPTGWHLLSASCVSGSALCLSGAQGGEGQGRQVGRHSLKSAGPSLKVNQVASASSQLELARTCFIQLQFEHESSILFLSWRGLEAPRDTVKPVSSPFLLGPSLPPACELNATVPALELMSP